jgi:hypothetical protein
MDLFAVLLFLFPFYRRLLASDARNAFAEIRKTRRGTAIAVNPQSADGVKSAHVDLSP